MEKKENNKTTKKKHRRGANVNETSKAKARSMQRQEEALEHRIAGLSYGKIAKQMGLARSRCHALVVNALKDSASRIETNADNLRDMEITRIDDIIAACWGYATKGSTMHMRELRGFMEMRCKLLGIDAPAIEKGENLTDNSGNDGNIIIHKHYH